MGAIRSSQRKERKCAYTNAKNQQNLRDRDPPGELRPASVQELRPASVQELRPLAGPAAASPSGLRVAACVPPVENNRSD
ncbi:hypothetical protein NHX12_005146, partial [Muraenolepis orangiensis]